MRASVGSVGSEIDQRAADSAGLTLDRLVQDRLVSLRCSRLAIAVAVSLLVIAHTVCCGVARAENREHLWLGGKESGEIEIKLYFFWSETCPHCAKAQPFVDALASEFPWLRVDSREVTRSEANLKLFLDLAAATEEEITGVPTFFLCGQMLVGFDSADGIGAHLRRLAEACHAAVVEGRDFGAGLAPTPSDFRLPFLGAVDFGSLSLPVVTVLLGGLDAFNPCAFFVLLFLLSLLVHARSRIRMFLIGGIFVLVSGVVYFAFMAAWLNLFLVLEGVKVVTTFAGVVAVAVAVVNIKDFFFFKKGVSLSIPESAKSGLFVRMRGLVTADNLPVLLTGTFMLAIAANAYELLCTSGLPLVYTRILTLEPLPRLDHYLYLALYNAVYVLPLLVIVIVFTLTLGARRLTEDQGRALKLLSGLMMLGLGLVLIFAPDWLDNVLTAFALLAFAVAGTVLLQLGRHAWTGRMDSFKGPEL